MNDALVTDDQLDRLVDGELPDDAYRRLLSTLDDEPSGWRRLALAFLEAQALSRDLALPVAEPPLPVKTADGRPPATSLSSFRWPLMGAMAACFLVALTIGLMFPYRTWMGVPPNVAEQEDDGTSRHVAETGNGSTVDTPGAADVAAGAAAGDSRLLPEEDAARSGSPGNSVIIEYGDGDFVRRSEVPYYEVDEYRTTGLSEADLFPNPDFARELRNSGHDLRRQLRLLPIELPNGRRMVVPMDEVEIVPVGGPGYQ